jgi:hypothetical protein
MSTIDRDRWVILAAEGVAIVISILLAFAIDAWWDERADRKQEAALLASLHADFRASQAHLEDWAAGNRVVQRTTSELLERIRTAERDEAITVFGGHIVGAISTPTYSPTDATLRAAISSGQIELIRSEELRKELAVWDQLLADTVEDEILIREIVVHRIIPLLSEQVRLGYLLEFGPVVDLFLRRPNPIGREPVELRADPRLEAAVAERLFHTIFVVQGLADLHDSQARILDLLAEQLDLESDHPALGNQ